MRESFTVQVMKDALDTKSLQIMGFAWSAFLSARYFSPLDFRKQRHSLGKL